MIGAAVAGERTGSRPLAGRVVLVTGAAERVGAVLARSLTSAGASVVVNHLDRAEAATELVAEMRRDGADAFAIEADVSDPAACDRMVAEVVERLGRIDVLVHNASSFVQRDFLDLTPEDYELSMGVHVRGPLFLSQAAARHMLAAGSGKIIAIVGNSLHETWPDFVSHTVAKGALARLMESLAIALSPTVQCLTVAPAEILPTGRAELDDGARQVEDVSLVAGSPADLAELVTYLCWSTRYLNGATIPLDGGKSLV